MFEEVYKLVKRIPSGNVATYGQIAEVLGTKDARKIGPRTTLTSSRGLRPRVGGASIRGKWAISPQLVGFALHANRDPNVPCHRVVNKDGRLAPNFAFSAKSDKSRILGGPARNSSSRRVRTEPRSREVSLGGDGWKEQKRRLEAEGVTFKDKNHVDLEKHLW